MIGLPTVVPALSLLSVLMGSAVCERPGPGDACALDVLRLEAGEETPIVDGRLDEPVWARAMVATDFKQFEPDPGRPASERTEARIIIDGTTLYVGLRMYDSDVNGIRAQFVRRDDFEAVSDWAHVYIDSYHDRRTAFHFATTPAGARVDILHLEDTNQDPAWDAVWDVATSVDAEGWSAEFRIPLSQLRFGDANATWGVNFMRQIARRSEVAYWSEVAPESGRLVSLFGELRGVEGLTPPGNVELLPYSLARLRSAPAEPGDPFNDGSDYWGSGGLDLKYGLTSDLTLTATVNPDFGQVDADPSQVNLGTFETFFAERRPFFTEGAEIFRFPLVPEGHVFYSRRVGRTPQLSASAPAGGFVDRPESAKILGAAKLSGKTSSGWSIGAMHAVTGRAEAKTAAADGARGAVPVEPRSQYSVVRLLKDFSEGRSGLGFIGTGVHREDAPEFETLHTSAYSAGANGWHRFGGSRFQLRGWMLGTHVRGSEAALIRTQRSFVHLFQRPDAEHLGVDSTATSLTGYAGEAFIEKTGGGHWTGHVGGGIRTPGADTNDAGFISYTDVWWTGARARYSEFSAGSLFRNWWAELELVGAYTTNGEVIRPSAHFSSRAQLLNFWTATLDVDRWNSHVWPWELRGGPLLRRQGYTNARYTLRSDSRKAWSVQLRGRYQREDGIDSRVLVFDPVVDFRPTSRASVSLSPAVTWNRKADQYVSAASRSDGSGTEYLLGELDQTEASLTVRLSYSFSSDLTFDLYAQPFLSSGAYTDFARVSDPGAKAYGDRLSAIDAVALSLVDGRYQVDTDADGTAEYSFRDRDFNVREINTNAVLRWEYKPGSTLYVVWSQARNDYLRTGGLALGTDLDRLFDAPPTNVFMVKLSYWLGA